MAVTRKTYHSYLLLLQPAQLAKLGTSLKAIHEDNKNEIITLVNARLEWLALYDNYSDYLTACGNISNQYRHSKIYFSLTLDATFVQKCDDDDSFQITAEKIESKDIQRCIPYTEKGTIISDILFSTGMPGLNDTIMAYFMSDCPFHKFMKENYSFLANNKKLIDMAKEFKSLGLVDYNMSNFDISAYLLSDAIVLLFDAFKDLKLQSQNIIGEDSSKTESIMQLLQYLNDIEEAIQTIFPKVFIPGDYASAIVKETGMAKDTAGIVYSYLFFQPGKKPLEVEEKEEAVSAPSVNKK